MGVFWEAARRLDPDLADEAAMAGAHEGHLGQLFRAAGLRDVEETVLAVSVEHLTFQEWWEPFTLGVGPPGAHVTSLDADQRGLLRAECRTMMPAAPFVVNLRAWAARGAA